MVRPGSVTDPKHWYDRAAAMRVLAEEMPVETKTIMLRLAADYDKLADRAEERRRNNVKTSKAEPQLVAPPQTAPTLKPSLATSARDHGT